MSRTPPATIADLHAGYRAGTWRPSEVVEHWLARDAAQRERPVFISTFDAATLRERAADLDRWLARDPVDALSHPVFGALCAVKDNIDVAGLPTTAACPGFAYDPVQDASAVALLLADGAIHHRREEVADAKWTDKPGRKDNGDRRFLEGGTVDKAERANTRVEPRCDCREHPTASRIELPSQAVSPMPRVSWKATR